MTIYEVPKSLGADLTWCRNDFFRSAEITWGRFDLLPLIVVVSPKPGEGQWKKFSWGKNHTTESYNLQLSYGPLSYSTNLKCVFLCGYIVVCYYSWTNASKLSKLQTLLTDNPEYNRIRVVNEIKKYKWYTDPERLISFYNKIRKLQVIIKQ